MRFDNTVKGGLTCRTQDAEPALVDSFRQVPTGAPPPAPASFSFPQALNFNAGDDNFRKQRRGVRTRLDLLSEFDAVCQKKLGVRVSAAAWYDGKLHRKTQADNDPMIGQTPFDEFPEHTRKMAGKQGGSARRVRLRWLGPGRRHEADRATGPPCAAVRREPVLR